MLYCTAELRSITASFRNPDFQNFHKSFALPPPTALAGLAGAALGKSPKTAQDFLADAAFRMGVRVGSKGFLDEAASQQKKGEDSRGMVRDLWKYRTLKDNDPTSVITREVYVHNRFYVAFGSNNHEAVEQLYAALRSPVFALTLGQSDSLAKVVSVHLTEQVEESYTIGHTLVEGDVVPLILEQAFLGGSFSLTISQNDPVAYNLPTRFQYESDYGVRRVIARRLFSFVGPSITFKNKSYPGVRVGDVFVPTFAF